MHGIENDIGKADRECARTQRLGVQPSIENGERLVLLGKKVNGALINL